MASDPTGPSPDDPITTDEVCRVVGERVRELRLSLGLTMERLAEGKSTRRRKLDKGPWNREKILRKSAKQAMWIGFSLWTGITFVGYFTPIRELFGQIASFSLGPWVTFWCLFYSFATYGNSQAPVINSC